MPKILVAPTAYKGTLSPAEVALAMVRGINACGVFDTMVAPVADGGDGTIESLNMALGGQIHWLAVEGPLSQPVLAGWLSLGRLAVVELASASGIKYLYPEQLRPLDAHTHGLGELLCDCLKSGYSDVVITVGGSASTDGGTATLRALGARFRDSCGDELPPGGGPLTRLASVDLAPAVERVRGVKLRVASDVTNPLLGKHGAAAVFAPQKGADPAQVALLEQALARYADVLEGAAGRACRDLPGAGAAGGTAFGIACALGARLVPGFAFVCDLIGLRQRVAACDLVITGEGRLDRQSLSGKVAGELGVLCKEAGKKLWVVPGSAQEGVEWREFGIEIVAASSRAGGHATADDITRVVRELVSRRWPP